ncbi:NUDIX hydrolase [Pseudonocardia sp. ICBG1293]|uniref:NUDIX hydrolase n=1 Tax=Pseudonocardia sp. ICBG1293 TaxID=2844382 RepID=UPI001CCE333E|nr:NUDIX hydrolase [Pseudonocardia sp. ICBG1293]
MSTALVAGVAAPATLLVVALTLWCVTRVRRLHRLHVRVDAARAGLATALDTRARAALAVADALGPAAPPDLRRAALVARALHAPAPDGRDPAGARAAREAAENALTRQLAAVARGVGDTATDGDLADAEALVVLARRVHNDAVRDTRALRSRWLVRTLRLHGTAPEPVYFEIADPEPPRSPARPHVESPRSPTVM